MSPPPPPPPLPPPRSSASEVNRTTVTPPPPPPSNLKHNFEESYIVQDAELPVATTQPCPRPSPSPPLPPRLQIRNEQPTRAGTPPLEAEREQQISPTTTEPPTPLAELDLSPPTPKSPVGFESVQQSIPESELTIPKPDNAADSVSLPQENEEERMSDEIVSTEFVYPYGKDVNMVQLVGSWNGWYPITMFREGQGKWSVVTKVPAGTHEFMFIVDGEWTVSESHPADQDAKTNIRVVKGRPRRSEPMKAPVETVARNSTTPTCCTII